MPHNDPAATASEVNQMAVTISLTEVYKTLLEVQLGVRDINAKLGELAHDSRDHEDRLRAVEAEDLRGIRKTQADLSERVRSLEASVWKASGAAVVVASVTGYVLSQIFG